MTQIDTTALAQLAYWARNLVAIRRAGMSWPGFSDSDDEWTRMGTLAEVVSASGDYGAFKLVNAAVFIAMAAAAMFGIFLPLATLLFPVAADTKPLPFVLLLAACALLII